MPERRQAGLGLLAGYAGLEPRNQREPDGLMIVQVVARRHPGHGDLHHADGDEDAGPVAADGGVEVLRRYAENGEGVAVDQHRLADNIARCGEARLPVVVAEHHNRIGILGRVVLRREQAAQRGLEPEQLKVIAG